MQVNNRSEDDLDDILVDLKSQMIKLLVRTGFELSRTCPKTGNLDGRIYLIKEDTPTLSFSGVGNCISYLIGYIDGGK